MGKIFFRNWYEFLLESYAYKLAMIALSTVKSSTQTRIHNAILFIDTASKLDKTMLIL